MKHLNKKIILGDVLASIVVFLVAVPLCLGIALACGLPPIYGLVSGIIGGIVVGGLSGAPLMVSGPAAGLITIVYDIVQSHGVEALGVSILAAGFLQVIVGLLNMARWFRAVSLSVIEGMLAGIGVVIFASQFHVMIDDRSKATALENLLSLPAAVSKAVNLYDGMDHHFAALVGIATILSIVGWNQLPKHGKLRLIPAPLVGVLVAIVISHGFDFPIQFLDVPKNALAQLNFLHINALPPFSWAFIYDTITIAFVASAESLLTSTAIDHMHTGIRTNYRREMIAQGIGNMLAGVVGAIPITGVIVRSAANVQAGAKTRWSAVIHGLWILLLVTLFANLFNLIPTSSLAAILVYTGWKLFNPAQAKKLLRYGKSELVIFIVTVIAIVLTSLLEGIIIGFALSLARLLYALCRLDINMNDDGSTVLLTLAGSASFVSLPRIAETIEDIPTNRSVCLNLERVDYIDSACVELLNNWANSFTAKGGSVSWKRNDLVSHLQPYGHQPA
ncbi:MAG: SulP family inorganic anion transporter [Cyanobacteria bacterium HKST-UBA04]|nr:SulP family inorganic anion transporter [Cyanobacteria bacterium HKST-UBA04]